MLFVCSFYYELSIIAKVNICVYAYSNCKSIVYFLSVFVTEFETHFYVILVPQKSDWELVYVRIALG